MSLRTCFRICLMKKRFFIRQKANVELSENKSLRLNSSISESRFDMFPCLLPRNEMKNFVQFTVVGYSFAFSFSKHGCLFSPMK